MRAGKGWWVLLLLLAWVPASARDSCHFFRDPAFWAQSPLAPAAAPELAVATLNVYNLFDDEDDRGERTVLTQREFAARTARIARHVVQFLGAPAVLGLQEVEDDTALRALAAALQRETGRRWQYVAGEVSGDGEIRNALLLDARLRVTGTQSLFARSPRAGLPLHDRLPLVVDVDAGAHGLLRFVVVHLKSQRGLDKPAEAARVQAKRRHQAGELAGWLRREIAAGRHLVVLGDFNASPGPADAPASEPLRILLDQGGLADPAPRFLKASQRWTYLYRKGCALQQLDHVLVAPALAPRVGGYHIGRGDSCIRAREKCDLRHSVSDHDGVVLRLRPLPAR